MKKYSFLIFLLIISCLRVYMKCYDKSSGDFSICSDPVRSWEREEEDETKLESILSKIRNKSASICRQSIPSPYSELLLGMVIGVDEFHNLPFFKEELKRTGVIHVVVVSGFNITLVFGAVLKLLKSRYKLKNMLIAQFVTLFYSLLSGFEPPVFRSLIMGSCAAWGKYYGRSIDGTRLLLFSALIMLVIDPKYLFSLSYQLSVTATLGLILFSDVFKFKSKCFILEDLSSSLSAQVFVWVLISRTFGTVSILSPLVNMFLLWTVPIATILGFIQIFAGFISVDLAKLVGLVVFPFLDIFVRGVTTFSKIKYVSIDWEISKAGMWLYHGCVVIVILYLNSRKKRCE